MVVTPPDERHHTEPMQPQKDTTIPNPLVAICAIFAAFIKLFVSKETEFNINSWLRGKTDAHDYLKIDSQEIKGKIEGIATIDDYRRFCRSYNTTKLFEVNLITNKQKDALDKLYLILSEHKPKAFSGNRIEEIWNERFKPEKYNLPSDATTQENERETLSTLCKRIAENKTVPTIPRTFQEAIDLTEKLKTKDENLRAAIKVLVLPKETMKNTFKYYGRFVSNRSEVITVAQWEELLLSGKFPQEKELYNIDSWKNLLKIAKTYGTDDRWYAQIKTAIDTAGDYKGLLWGTNKTESYKPEKLYTALGNLLPKE